VNVRRKMPQIFVVLEMRSLESVLKYVSDVGIFGIEIHRVACREPQDQFAYRNIAVLSDEKVEMVRHDAIACERECSGMERIQPKAQFSGGNFGSNAKGAPWHFKQYTQAMKEVQIILRIAENIHLAIPTIENMVIFARGKFFIVAIAHSLNDSSVFAWQGRPLAFMIPY